MLQSTFPPFFNFRKPILPIEMELGDLEMNGSVSDDQKAIEEHCEKIALLKEKVFNSAEENIKCAQVRYTRKTLTINMLEGGRYEHAIIQQICSYNVGYNHAL